MAEPKMVLELAGHEVAVSNPSKVYFPRAGVTKLDMVRYYLAVAPGALGGVRGRPMALKRFVNGAEAEPFFQKRAPEKRPDFIADRRAQLPLRPHRGRGGRHRRGRAGLGDQPRLHRPQPAPGARRRPGPPGRAPGRPRPGARGGMAADQGRGHGGQGRAGRLRADRLAEDLRVARHAHLRPDRAALGVRRGAARGGRGGAGDRAAGARDCHLQVVEGGAARRLRGLQPERQGPHGRVRLLAAPGPRRAGVDAADLGGGAVVRSGRAHHRHRARTVRADRRPVGGDGRGGRVAGRAAGAGGQGRGGGAARRAVAAALREADRRGAPGAAVQAAQLRVGGRQEPDRAAAEHDAADRDRPGGDQGRGDGGPGALEGQAPEVWPQLEPADVLVDAMRGRSSLWYRIRLNLRHVPEAERPPQEPLEVDYDPWAGPDPVARIRPRTGAAGGGTRRGRSG